MANVDQCVRECEAALCRNTLTHSINIAKLPNNERVVIFRYKTADDICSILGNCKEAIQINIVNEFYKKSINIGYKKIILKSSSNNNKEGADIIHQLPSGKIIDIEVKFGAETNKAIGMSQFAIIFGTDIFAEILNSNNRKKWQRKYIINHNEAYQLRRLSQALNTAVDKFNKFNRFKNFTLTKEEQIVMEELVINNSGDSRSKSDYYLKFIVEGGNLRDLKKIPTKIGSWNVLRVKKLNNSIKRVNVFIVNRTTNIQIKYTLNWKNNYQIPGNGKAPAKLGFGSPSWNVWIDVELTEL